MEHLTKFEAVLFAGELEIAADEDEHAACGSRGLTVDGGDAVLALLEGKAGELSNNVLGTLNLLTFKAQHGSFLVQIRQSGTIRITATATAAHLPPSKTIHSLTPLHLQRQNHPHLRNCYGSSHCQRRRILTLLLLSLITPRLLRVRPNFLCIPLPGLRLHPLLLRRPRLNLISQR